MRPVLGAASSRHPAQHFILPSLDSLRTFGVHFTDVAAAFSRVNLQGLSGQPRLSPSGCFSSSGGCTSLSVYLPQDQSQVCFPLPEESEQAGKGFPIVFLAHGGDSRDPPLQGHGGWGLILSCPMWNQDAKYLKQPLV